MLTVSYIFLAGSESGLHGLPHFCVHDMQRNPYPYAAQVQGHIDGQVVTRGGKGCLCSDVFLDLQGSPSLLSLFTPFRLRTQHFFLQRMLDAFFVSHVVRYKTANDAPSRLVYVSQCQIMSGDFFSREEPE